VIDLAYVKKVWDASQTIDVADLTHMEEQVTVGLSDLVTHDYAGHLDTYYTKAEMDSFFWNVDNDGPGSTLDVDKLEGLHASEILSGIQPGFMAWWDARNGAIPTGWIFCDGSSGTLDMRGRFPVGVGTLSVGAIGSNSTITPEGSISVGNCTLTARQIKHVHQYVDQCTTGYGGKSGAYYPNVVYSHSYGSITSTDMTYVGGGLPHNHPGSFAGASASMLPLYNYFVVIQKS
jgi:hypothetical protein